jgi:hypothetical protein
MRIGEFYEYRLNAPLKNKQWSWGAIDESAKRVFLRTNEKHISQDAGRWALIYDPEWNPSAGHKERLYHIDLIRSGYAGFVVRYRMNEHGKIYWFDQATLLTLGKIVEEEGCIYSKIRGDFSVDGLGNLDQQQGLADDLAEISNQPDKTDVTALIKARLGQGKFRESVLKMWGRRCCVTGVGCESAIRASHIKPWRVCSNKERLDRFNGLPLVATLDALFDDGLITFDKMGQLLISPQLDAKDKPKLKLDGLAITRKLPKETEHFMRYHREVVFSQH